MSTAQTLDRDVAQSLITKLDLGHIRPKDAKEFAQKYCGVTLKGRTRDQLVRSINSVIEPARPAPEAGLTEAETLAVIADRRDQKPAVTGLRLQDTIGTGSKLYTVVCTGDDWDGFATWLVRAADLGMAIYTAQAQYHDLPEYDRPTDWQATFVGDFA